MSKSRFFCGGSVLAVTLSLAMGVSSSWAQTAAAQEETTVDEVISTGTFIRGAAEDAALPVEVIGRDELLRQGSPTMEELVRNFSEIGNVQGQSARGSNADGYGVSTINLRNLGSGRTLITMNGRRLADEPVSSGGNINVTGGANQNVNSIPTAALQQVEVLKGGGGATYGADAVAGVVNFITRRDLNGVEVNGSYKYVPDSDGDYDASLLWGRRNDTGNVLLSFEYQHGSKLAAKDRDWAARSFYISENSAGSGGPFQGELGSYQFLTSGATAAITAANGYQGAGVNASRFPAIGASGLLRDDACLTVGGYRTFSTTPSPTCSFARYQVEDIADNSDTYRVFGDANFDVSDTLRYHGEVSFSKNVQTISGLDLALNAPCDPLPSNAPPASTVAASARACTAVAISGVGTNSYVTPGFNPAVYEYLTRYYNNPLSGVSQRVLTDAQIASITGQTVGGAVPNTVNGGVLNQGYNPAGFGRVTLPSTTWDPFIAAKNPAFSGGENTFKNESISFRTTQEIKGDLGEIMGNQVDFAAAVTYSRNISSRKGKFVLIDRLQRALNGFATNLDDLGGGAGEPLDGCSTADTIGTRLVNGVPVTNVPYTVGAGGGKGDAANGFNAGAAAGNGCYFFNPFLSAVGYSRLTEANTPLATATDTGFMGGSAVGGTFGDYQGYAPGYGLANAPGIIKWLYDDREVRSQSDNVFVDLVFNGSIGQYELPGGPIGWALGGQYRYVNRQAQASGLADEQANPCSFLNLSADGLTDIDNIVNATSTCTGTTGLFQSANANFNGTGFRETVSHALFTEFSLPVLDNLGVQFAARYEETKLPNIPGWLSATVLSGSLKYQVTPTIALRASVGETFDTPTIEAPGTQVTDAAAAGVFYGAASGIDDTAVAPFTQAITVNATDLDPETGLHYEVGALFQSEDRRIQGSLGYYHNVVNGQPTVVNATSLGRALVGVQQVGAAFSGTQVLDCANPTVQALFDPARSPALLNGRPFVSYTDSAGNLSTGCRAGTTLGGLNANGNVDPVTGLAIYTDPGDLGLVFASPSRINAGKTTVSGLESSLSYRFADPIFEGILILNSDITVNLERRSSEIKFLGTTLTAAQDDLGTLASGFAVQGNIWRGSIGGVYLRGKHTFSLNGYYIGGYADLATANQLARAVPGNPSSNLNPPDPSLCAVAGVLTAPLPIKDGGFPTLEPILTGDQPYNVNCSFTNGLGIDARESFMINGSWRYEMPRDTTLTVAIDNIMDKDPPYLGGTYNYNPFGSVGVQGRTIKVGIQKKFAIK